MNLFDRWDHWFILGSMAPILMAFDRIVRGYIQPLAAAGNDHAARAIGF